MLQPWYVRTYPLHHRRGHQVFEALYGQSEKTASSKERGWQAISTLLESPYPSTESVPQSRMIRYSICAGRPRCQDDRPSMWVPTVGTILDMLSTRLATPKPAAVLLDEAGQPWPETLEPFAGGWLGWLGYDLAREIEVLPTLRRETLPFPVAFWYEPETFAILDHHQQRLWLAATVPEDLEPMADRLSNPCIDTALPAPVQSAGLILGSSQAAYQAAVDQAKRHIQAGDIFQANLSLRFAVDTTADSWTIYRRLQEINPSPFASYWRTPWGNVVSCSPERLVSLQGRRVETRPIAGTRSRGQSPREDDDFAQQLRDSAKDRAEHIMLVDLERNDLGRVCTWGSIRVDELMVIEPYSHVMHLTSNVVGSLKPGLTAVDLIRAVFPGGTITGCPKVRCMEIIEALEPLRRSLFYGSCGYLDCRGHLDLNILIRTLLCIPHGEQHSTIWGQVGAGIVADSQPELEWQESLQKAKAQLLAIGTPVRQLHSTLPTS